MKIDTVLFLTKYCNYWCKWTSNSTILVGKMSRFWRSSAFRMKETIRQIHEVRHQAHTTQFAIMARDMPKVTLETCIGTVGDSSPFCSP